jgi:N-ethylmaleimide reductase
MFSPARVGAVALPNRFVMAPMTRGRADAGGIPNDLMATYYAQRAATGLLVTEATPVCPGGVGWVGAPGIWTAEQEAGWRRVTDAVHGAGGRIFLQLWHMGRVSHPDFLGGALPVGPSAVAAKGETTTPLGKKPYVTPRALDSAEIPAIVRDFGRATARARAAGFDGVELHGANGYLVDQFLRDGSNRRTDAWGGPVSHRARFLLEVVEAMAAAWAPDRVGVRLSPRGAYNDMADSDPVATFAYAAERLKPYGLAYLHVLEALPGHMMHAPGERVSPSMRKAFGGPFVANGGYTADKAEAALAAGEADLVAFGVPVLANPDFVERVRRGAPMNQPDFATLYTPGPKVYTDYPRL